MGCFIDDNKNILMEAFYGKPKEFIEIERLLDKIIEMIKYNKQNPSTAININKTRELMQIEKIFTKFFKVDEVSITFYNALHLLNMIPDNAYTIPSSINFFKRNPSNKRLARPEDLYINVNIDANFVYSLDLNAQETMAIILHEIGHDFDASFFTLLSNINIGIIDGINDGEIVFNENPIAQSAINTFFTFIFKSKPMAQINQMINRLLSDGNPIIITVSNIYTFIIKITRILDIIKFFSNLGIIFNPILVAERILQPRNLFGYSGEKFADSFASSYGYAKPLSSAFTKMETGGKDSISKIAKDIPILNLGYDLTMVFMRTSTLLFDPHPSMITRISSQLDKLKRDINDPNLDSKVKKELMANIDDLENYINNVTLNIEADPNRGKEISFAWNYVVYKLFGGKIDFRELFEVIWNHEM